MFPIRRWPRFDHPRSYRRGEKVLDEVVSPVRATDWRFDPDLEAWWSSSAAAVVSPSLLVGIPPAQRYRMHQLHGLPAAAFDGRPGAYVSMTCPDCWMVSRNRHDAEKRYCGACHWATGDPAAGEPPAGRATPVFEDAPGLREITRLATEAC